MGIGGSNRAQREAEAQERERQAAIRSGTEQVRGIFANPARLSEIAEAVAATRAMLAGDLTRQNREATRTNRFALARSGQLGGSLQADRARQLAEAYGRGRLEVERRAQGVGANLRAADEDSQARLMGLVQGGLDATTAAQQAAQAMRSNLAAGAADRNAGDLGSMFAGITNAAQASRDAADRRRADRQMWLYAPNFGGRGR